MTDTKLCYKCNIEQPKINFYKNSRNHSDGLRTQCQKCTRAVYKKWISSCSLEERAFIRKDRRGSVRKLRKRNQEWILEYLKDKCCKDCGNSDRRVLEFDHLRDKHKNVSKLIASAGIDTILEEIKKCDIVCCNCHRIRTSQRAKDYRSFKNPVHPTTGTQQ